MHSTLAQDILFGHGIAYALTDVRLEIVHHSDNLKHHAYDTLLGVSLLTIAPEMRGNQDVLTALLDGKLERWEMPCVMRANGAGEPRLFYLRLTRAQQEPFPNGFLYTQHDLTAVGIAQAPPPDASDDLELFRQRAVRELRTSLTPLNGYLEMLADADFGELSARQSQVIATLRQGVQRIEKLGENWLETSRVP